MTEYARHVLEAASWTLASELVRRHPDDLRVLETHPGGGQYDCLSVHDARPPHAWRASLNRHGTIQGKPGDGFKRTWSDYLGARDPRAFVSDLERHMGLAPVDQTPPTTPRTLVYRVLAAVLRAELCGVRGREVLNGYEDSSGGWGGVRKFAFDDFPGIQQALSVAHLDDPLHQPAYRFWFVYDGNKPRLALEETGTAWTPKGQRLDLMAGYDRAGRRLWPLVATVGGRWV